MRRYGVARFDFCSERGKPGFHKAVQSGRKYILWKGALSSISSDLFEITPVNELHFQIDSLVLCNCLICSVRGIFTKLFILFGICGLAQDSQIIDSLKQAIRTAESDSLRADALNELAWKFYLINLDTAFILGEQALKVAQQANIPEEVADAHTNLGVVHAEKGNYKEALSSHQKALVIRQKS